MVALTGAMVIEKAFPRYTCPRRALGIALLLLAPLWILHPAWLVSAGVS